MELYGELAKTLGVPGFLCFIFVMVFKRFLEALVTEIKALTEVTREGNAILKAIREAQVLEHYGARGVKRLRGVVGLKGGGMEGVKHTLANPTERSPIEGDL